MLTALSFVLFSALLIAPAASPQMPPRPGFLHITSKQDGETIAINGKQRSEQTPVTLVVSPGPYTVEVSGCPGQQFQVTAVSGKTAEVVCSQ